MYGVCRLEADLAGYEAGIFDTKLYEGAEDEEYGEVIVHAVMWLAESMCRQVEAHSLGKEDRWSEVASQTKHVGHAVIPAEVVGIYPL